MPKHQQIKEALVESIRKGEYPAESRLPSERDLAVQFGVSYLTARRAVADLVEANLLERRARSGTYVRSHSVRRLATNTVHLICITEDRAINRSFLRIATRLITERGWQYQVIRVQVGEDRAAARAITNGGLAIVVLEGIERIDSQMPALADAMRRAEGRAVLLANRMDDVGVPSVVADDTHALRMAVSHLHQYGHRHIALLSDIVDHPVARVQIAAWRSACSDDASPETLRQRLIPIHTDSYDCLPTTTHAAVRAFLQSEPGKPVTALISLVDEMALPALAACREEGRPVPEAFAMVSLGDSAVLAFAHPPVTVVDVDLERHLQLGLSMLEAASQGHNKPEDRLRLVEPRLVIRQSVQQAPGT